MNYSKPLIRPLDLHVDVASCKPSHGGCPGLVVAGLCFASRTVVVVQAGGRTISVGPDSIPSPTLAALPDVGGLDGAIVLP